MGRIFYPFILAGGLLATAANAQLFAVELRSVARSEVEGQFAYLLPMADRNHDGSLEADELAGFTPEERTRMMADYDANADGKISAAEYTTRALGTFDAVDANRDRVASVAEQRAALARSPRR